MELRIANYQDLANVPEIWKDIPGYEGLYAAYDKGAVLSRITGKLLKPMLFKSGYVYVTLSKNGRKKNKSLHRIIAATFIPNPENKPEVNHKTGIKTDNHFALLEWATESENKKHAYANGLNRPSRHRLGMINELHFRSKQVDQFDLKGNFIKHWPSIAEAQRHGFQTANICKVCKGERPTHKGFIWKYSNNQNQN